MRRVVGGAVVLALVVAGAFGLGANPAAAQPQVIVVSGQDKHAGEFIIPVNKSQVLRLDVPLKDLLVGNAEIADVLALTDRSVYVLGKSVGSTSLTLYGANKQLIAVLDLVVSYDIDGLKAKLFEVMPEEDISVRVAGGSLLLSGVVSGASRLSHALDIASRYAGGAANITNLLSVQGSQQVMFVSPR
jgi:pilus assembly protein CpaC